MYCAPRNLNGMAGFGAESESKISNSVHLCVTGPGLPDWPFWGQISEIWSQITLARPKILFGPLALFCPFSRIDWPLARIRSDHPGSCLRNHIFSHS